MLQSKNRGRDAVALAARVIGYVTILAFTPIVELRVGWLMAQHQDSVTQMFIWLTALLCVGFGVTLALGLEFSDTRGGSLLAALGLLTELAFVVSGVVIEQSHNTIAGQGDWANLLGIIRAFLMPSQAVALFLFVAFWLSAGTDSKIHQAEKHSASEIRMAKSDMKTARAAHLLQTGVADLEIDDEAHALLLTHRNAQPAQNGASADPFLAEKSGTATPPATMPQQQPSVTIRQRTVTPKSRKKP